MGYQGGNVTQMWMKISCDSSVTVAITGFDPYG